MTDEELIKKGQDLVITFYNGKLEVGNRGYFLPYYDLINIGYLYLHGVDARFPSLLDPNSDNSFIPDFMGDYVKINEQTRIDFKELGFAVDNKSDLGEFVVKGANRKVMNEDNDWTDENEKVTDDANWYGSGYKKVWVGLDGIQRHRHIDPWAIIWNLHNFKKSAKMEQLRKTVKEVVNNERYSKESREALARRYKDDMNHRLDSLYQYVDKDKLVVMDILNEMIFLNTDRPKQLWYVKYDHEYRRGFKDAPGRGIFEKIMNVIVQNKVARRRLNAIQEITSNLIYAKIKEKNDKIVNKNLQSISVGKIIPVTSVDNIPKPVDLGGQKQVVELQNKIVEMQNLTKSMLGTPEVLSGDSKELGAGSSGVARQSLAEYASSVHKDVKKRYARVVEYEYNNYISDYILGVLDSKESIKKYLNEIEFNTVKRKVIDNELAVNQRIELAKGNEFDLASERIKLEKRVLNDGFIPGDLLDALRKDVKGIKIVVSGEKASRQVRTEFIDMVKNDFMANPEILKNKSYVGIIKKRAKIIGLDELEVSEFISELIE